MQKTRTKAHLLMTVQMKSKHTIIKAFNHKNLHVNVSMILMSKQPNGANVKMEKMMTILPIHLGRKNF